MAWMSALRRWRSLLGSGLPVAGAILVVVLVTGIGYFVYDANKRGAIVLANDLVSAIEERVAIEVHAYFDPSRRLLELIDDAANGRPVFEAKAEVESLALHALATIGSASGISYADPEGNFLYLLKSDQGGIDTKVIDRRNGGHVVTWTRRNAKGDVLATEEDLADTFDPRTRPFYVDAARAGKPVWTDTYEILTLHKPGISFAVPHFGPDRKLQTVLGIDIELASLDSFLNRLTIGVSGRAYIIDRSGRVVALPSDDRALANSRKLMTARLDELGDPILTRAYDRLRVEGPGRKVLNFGDRQVIISAAPVSMLTGRDWLVLIVVPEVDFIGFVSSSGLAALAMSLVVMVLVVGLAVLLAWRNIGARGRAAAAAARQRALEDRSHALVGLGRNFIADGEGPARFTHATEAAAEACFARRAAVWRLSDDGQTLVCEDYYDAAVKDHSAGLLVHRDEAPDLFAALEEGAVIDTDRKDIDRRVRELLRTYLEPLGLRNSYFAPVRLGGRLLGMLSVEEPKRGGAAAGMSAFCDALVVLLALRFGSSAVAAGAGRPPVTDAPVPAEATPKPGKAEALALRQTKLERLMIQGNTSPEVLRRSAVAGAAVGIVRLSDWSALARPPPGGTARTVMDAIVEEVQQVIAKCGVTYAALSDGQFVLVDLPSAGGATAADPQHLALALLQVRDRLLDLGEKWVIDLDFRLAMDVGTVMQSVVGTIPPSQALWGGSVGVAKILAETGVRQAITVTETAHDLLFTDFLMRPRGTYFLPETGTIGTFILVGRT